MTEMKLTDGTSPAQDEKKHGWDYLGLLGGDPNAKVVVLDSITPQFHHHWTPKDMQPPPIVWDMEGAELDENGKVKTIPGTDFSKLEQSILDGVFGLGKTSGKSLGMMGLLYGTGPEKLLHHYEGAGGLTVEMEMGLEEWLGKKLYLTAKPPRHPASGDKPWEAALPQDREIEVKGFRTKLGKAKTKLRARAKAARKARRR